MSYFWCKDGHTKFFKFKYKLMTLENFPPKIPVELSLRFRVPGISQIFFFFLPSPTCHSLPLLSVCLSKYSIFCPLIWQRKWCVRVSLFSALIVLGRRVQTGGLSATLCELALRLCVGEVHYACTVLLFWCTSELNIILMWAKRCKSMHLVFAVNFDLRCMSLCRWGSRKTWPASACHEEIFEGNSWWGKHLMSHESKRNRKTKKETNPRILKLQTGYDSRRHCSINTLRLFLLPSSRMQRVYSPPCSLLRGNALSDETLSSLVCSFLYYFIVSLKSRQHLCACAFELCEC